MLSAEGERLPATGPSFRDVTRVAGANTAVVGRHLPRQRRRAGRRRSTTWWRASSTRGTCWRPATATAIAAWNDAAREDRRRLLESDLDGGEVHELRVLVPNRPGIVAEIALALGRATIDIVDMGLYPSCGTHGTVCLWIRGGVVAEQAERPRPRPGAGGGAGMKRRFDPSGPLRGTLRAPGDKSLSHRAALFGAMCADPVHVTGYLDAADTRSTLDAVRALGALVEEGAAGHADDPRAGAARRASEAHIDVGNAGTLMRLLPGLARRPARRASGRSTATTRSAAGRSTGSPTPLR